MSCDPTAMDKHKLDQLATAIADACRAEWTVYRLKGPGWLDVACAPAQAIADALDTAYRIGRAAAAEEKADE